MLEKSFFYQEILQKGREEGQRKERLLGIELALDVKFGNDGLQLMSEISEIFDLTQLRDIQKYILTVNSLNKLQDILQNINNLEDYVI
ncbi:hypothetical protein VB711_06220 [Cronbergia sp. UHCC 0137]|uniref:hypothetical protein n=1 Tax=Cronbergia sp. UHCC 0137 TaxID=3110239 RepID=UPI002B1FFD9E|nr:hypothetical protein [Cronbergia sp. UHCC 0137]MEA5617433.1 hypothetical protein [Cronbergia sp. UHCC 0137]